MNTFFPRAIVHEPSRVVLFVFHTEEHYKNFAHIPTVDAPGKRIHPALINKGDVIDFSIIGWTKGTVESVKFEPQFDSLSDMTGNFQFTLEGGSFRNCIVRNAQYNALPLYIFGGNL